MIFTSLVFAVLLLATLAAHWATANQQMRLATLFGASLVFYAWHHWPSVFLLLFSIAFNWAGGLIQAKREGAGRRGLIAVIIAANLGLLAWFKYAAFIATNLQTLAAAVGLHVTIPRPSPFLPLGISFFTFQVVAYQIDIHRGAIAPERSFLRFAVFKCFFAQLIAGPIVRAADLLPQLRERRRFNPEAFQQGIFLVVAGMALKLAVADVLVQYVDEAFRSPAALTTTSAWTGIYAFAFQLFADFWGYSTMAVGIGLLFGLDLPLNFNVPYLAQSLQEFWRRWHITLSRWFRDYLYVPLGGNRSHVIRNLLITMTLAGLWHGAGWTFICWGLAHGLWLAAERWARERTPGRHVGGFESLPAPIRTAVRVVLVFHGVCLLWVFFRAPTMELALQYLSRLVLPPYTATAVPGNLATWLIGFALLHPFLSRLFEGRRFVAVSIPAQVGLTVALVVFVLAHAGARIDFIYFTF